MIATLKHSLHPWRVELGRTMWQLRGRPAIGMYFKQQHCRAVARRFNCRILVETGTYRGDMVAALLPHMREIHSIELDVGLYERARRRFWRDTNVVLHHGDSGTRLRDVMPLIRERALFWLDGHYSGDGTAMGTAECPVIAELDAIAASPQRDHCIMIDDARLFGLNPAYPPLDLVVERARVINPRYETLVEHDCISILPPQ